jgi:ornithine carbamoyltransferase
MSANLTGKHFLRIRDFSAQEIGFLVDQAIAIKENNYGNFPNTIKKHAVCFFSLSSSRTKSAWEVASFECGMMNSYNDANSSQLGKKESIYDSAKVFSEFYDVIG